MSPSLIGTACAACGKWKTYTVKAALKWGRIARKVSSQHSACGCLRISLQLTGGIEHANLLHTTPIASPVGSRPPSKAVSVFARERSLITNVYIDGFNLYYRALKDTPFRWLDLRKLAETLFPEDTIQRICYFTARLDTRTGNPGQPRRQLIYLRALATLPGFEIHYGVFRSGVKRRPLAEPTPGLPPYVLVRDSEEKGSDVNLATRLLVDGFSGEYEQTVVVSNDADFAGAMRYVRDNLNLRLTLVNPDARRASPLDLSNAATYVKRLWKSHLRQSQLPDTLVDEVGAIAKPPAW